MKNSIMDYVDYPEHRILFSLSWPVVLSLLVQGLYTFVDSIFLARLGAEVLSAVSLSFVIQNLASSFFTGIAVGMNAVISKALGSGDLDTARSTVISGFLIQGAFCLCFISFGIFGVEFYFSGTTDNLAVIAYGTEYLTPIMILCMIMAAQITAERLLQSSGISRYTLCSQAVGTIVNIILDPIMIFGLLGCPKLGVSGAAYATLIGQFSAVAVAMLINFKKNTILFDRIFLTRFDMGVAWTVIKIGVPTAATGIFSSFGNYFINRILVGFSATANAAFGIYTKLQSIALMVSHGVSAGLVTMYSFFYGRKDLGRMNNTLCAGELITGSWGAFCFLIFFSIPTVLMAPFAPSREMLIVGVPCFKIIGITYLTSGLMSGLNSFFQATGHSQYTFLSSFTRMVLIRVPVAYFLASFGQVGLLWWCWPISEVVSDSVSFILFLRCYKGIRNELIHNTGKLK